MLYGLGKVNIETVELSSNIFACCQRTVQIFIQSNSTTNLHFMSGKDTSNDILCYEHKRLVLQKYSTFW